jgi:hypothetical protein
MNFFDTFIKVLDAFHYEKVEYILVGGFAVILYGLPRVTQGIDIFIRPDKDNINGLKRALESVFADESIEEISLEMLEEYPVVRYGSPDGFFIDIIIRLGIAFSYDDLKHVIKEIEGHPVRVATVKTLYDMKKDTVRPIDKSDSYFLLDLLNKNKGDH